MEKTINHIDAMLKMQILITFTLNINKKITNNNSFSFKIIQIY